MKPIGERMEALRDRLPSLRLVPHLRPAMLVHAANRHRVERKVFRDLESRGENTMRLDFGPIDEIVDLLNKNPQPSEHNAHPMVVIWQDDEYPDVMENPLFNEFEVTVASSPDKHLVICELCGVVREGAANTVKSKLVERLLLDSVLRGALTYKGEELTLKRHVPDGEGIGFNFKLSSGETVGVEFRRSYEEDSVREVKKLSIRVSSKPTGDDLSSDDFGSRIASTLTTAQEIVPTIVDLFTETFVAEPDEPVIFTMPIHRLRNQHSGKHAHESVTAPGSITASDEVSLFQLIARQPSAHTFELAGGLQPQVERLQRLITIARNTDSFTSRGLKPNTSVLLSGPPGTGKTMLAGIAANELGGYYLKVDCSDVLNKWVGESEARIRSIFRMLSRLSKEQPVTIFFDEFDFLGKKKGPNSPDWMRGITNTVLTCLNELPGNCIAMAAVNNPDDLEPAIKREGRFSEIEFKIPDDSGREAILRNWIKYYNQQSDNTAFGEIDVRQLVRRTPDFSGADLSSLLESGLGSHILRSIEDGRDIQPCGTEDLLRELTIMKKLKGISGTGGFGQYL